MATEYLDQRQGIILCISVILNTVATPVRSNKSHHDRLGTVLIGAEKRPQCAPLAEVYSTILLKILMEAHLIHVIHQQAPIKGLHARLHTEHRFCLQTDCLLLGNLLIPVSYTGPQLFLQPHILLEPYLCKSQNINSRWPHALHRHSVSSLNSYIQGKLNLLRGVKACDAGSCG